MFTSPRICPGFVVVTLPLAKTTLTKGFPFWSRGRCPPVVVVNDFVTSKLKGVVTGSKIAKNENPGVFPQIMLFTVSRDVVMSVHGGAYLYSLKLDSGPVTWLSS